jgi:hypothetical protein
VSTKFVNKSCFIGLFKTSGNFLSTVDKIREQQYNEKAAKSGKEHQTVAVAPLHK